MKKQVAVIGIGRFGRSVATELYNLGHDVLAIDKIEAFPVDVWIERIIKENYLPDPKVSKTVIRSWAQENFGSYAGYANHYLFHSTRTSET